MFYSFFVCVINGEMMHEIDPDVASWDGAVMDHCGLLAEMIQLKRLSISLETSLWRSSNNAQMKRGPVLESQGLLLCSSSD